MPSMLKLSPDPSFNFELLRALSATAYNGADVGEILTVAAELVPGDTDSYYAAFRRRADRLAGLARNMTNPVSIRDTLFRAATYYRNADFYLHANWDDPRINELWDLQTQAFDTANAQLTIPGVRVSLKADGFEVPAMFWRAAAAEGEKRPTLIMGTGFDGAMEELYHVFGVAGLERGYNILAYEGPGQHRVRREQGLPFTHEWEKVVTPCVDFLLTQSCVDPTRIVSFGFSLGGLLAVRAAAFEHRPAATVAIDGIYDFAAADLLSTEKLGQYAGVADVGATQALLTDTMVPTAFRWAIGHGLWAFKMSTVAELFAEFKKFTLAGLEDNIKGPVFVGEAEEDKFLKGQPEIVAEKLGSKATLHKFTSEDAAHEHCHEGANRLACQVVFDWLEEKVVKA